MKVALTIIATITLIASCIQRPAAVRAKPKPYGVIYNGNQWVNTRAFTANNIKASVNSGKIVIASGANGVSSLDYNYCSLLDNWNNTAKIQVRSKSVVIGVGIHSVSTWQGFSVYARLNISAGTLTIINGNTLPSYRETILATSAANLSINTNDYVILTLERHLDTICATATDITTGSASVSCSYGYHTNNTSNCSPNTGKYAIYGNSGSFILDSISITSKEIANANLLITTDSKGEYVANNFASRWPQQVANLHYPTVLSIGGTEGITEILNRMPEIIALSPRKVLLAVGRNDIAFGMNRDTLKARYLRAVSEMQAAGIEVYHINCIYEAVIGQNSFSRWITSHYTGNVIDTYKATSDAHNILSADSVHPNQEGNDLIATTIIKSGKLK